jgi:hypothetical protein
MKRPWRWLTAWLVSVVLCAGGVPAAAVQAQAAGDELRFSTNFLNFGVLQSELYELEVAAGELRFWVEGDEVPRTMDVLLYDVGGDVVVLQDRPTFTHVKSYTVTVPAGRYGLLLYNNVADYVGVAAPGLQLSPDMPAVELPDLDRLSIQNGFFEPEVALLNPAVAERLAIYLDDALIHEMLINPATWSGSVTAPMTTEGLEDGIHWVTAAAKANGANNLGLAETPVLVDRVDTFPDVPPSHWARGYIEAMVHLGVINGRDTGLYAPAEAVTRAEFAKLLASTLGLPVGAGGPSPFADTAGHWAEPYIVALWEAGLAEGEVVNGQRYFYPQRTLTRAEAATLIGRVFGVDGAPVAGEPFTDWAQVPAWARSSVFALTEAGWLNGFPDGTFGPALPLQRDQAAKLMGKFFGMR